MDIDWLIVANDVQRKIAEKYAPLCSPPQSTEQFLRAMRFQQCSGFVPIWRKYNRAARGSLEAGQVAIDCYLWNLRKGHYVTLLDLITSGGSTEKTTLTLMVSGSFS